MTARWRSLVAAALIAASPAAAKIRGVFVGIDTYAWSRSHAPENLFDDLHGAVTDVGHIKSALAKAYSLDLDVPSAGCSSQNEASVTLTDRCADRDAILAALAERISASAAGDTLIFYYAGHGSQFVDDAVFDQASRRNDTILPYNARQPGAAATTDILDRELRQIIDGATNAGVNVVTIFDSCHSGTATRGGERQHRSAPMLEHAAPPPALVPSATAPAPKSGYRVHLAAAADDEQADEIGKSGNTSGVFTTALATVLQKIPYSTFDDIANETRLEVEETSGVTQHPQAEGELRARIGGVAATVRLANAQTDGSGARLLAGRLSDVTIGSTFALFEGSTAAQDNAAPTATGTVTAVEDNSAHLTLDATPAAPLKGRLVARETMHAVPGRTLLIRAAPADQVAVTAALQGQLFAALGEPAQLVVSKAHTGLATLTTSGGKVVALRLGPLDGTSFAFNLRDALQKFARVQSLLALRTDPDRADLAFCIDTTDFDIGHNLTSCPPMPEPPSGRIAVRGGAERHLPRCTAAKLDDCATIKLAVVNASDVPRHLYVLGIDEAYGITVLLPTGHGIDPPVDRRTPLTTTDIWPDTPGRYRFVTIASAAAVDISLFEQTGTARGDADGCTSALQQALCSAHAGRRDLATVNAAAWTAIVSSVVIDPEPRQ